MLAFLADMVLVILMRKPIIRDKSEKEAAPAFLLVPGAHTWPPRETSGP